MPSQESGFPLLKIESLVKTFGTFTAVDGISFTVKQGQCFGLLGPNGAGKTTTIEMMEGITAATSGHIFYKGREIDRTFLQEVGIQFQHTALQDFLTVKDNLDFFSALYHKPADIKHLIERCALTEVLHRDTSKLSGGQRQRLLLAIALINSPEIVFLDEPTTGLDPQSRRNFWDLVRELKAEGKTILLTTHYMDEAQALCDEIAIMDHGHIIAMGSPKQLLQKHFNMKVVRIPLQEIRLTPGITSTRQDGEWLEIHTEKLDQALESLIHEGVSLNQMEIRNPDLEDLFIELTGKQLRH